METVNYIDKNDRKYDQSLTAWSGDRRPQVSQFEKIANKS